MDETFSGCVTDLNIELPLGVRVAKGLQPFEFRWSAPDGAHFTDYSLCASDSKGLRRFDRELNGPKLWLERLEDMSTDKALWEEVRAYKERTNPRPTIAEAYATTAFEYMIGVKSKFTLSLMPRNRQGRIELWYQGSAGSYLWETSWDVSDMLPCFTFDADVIDWNAESHRITQPQAQAA